MKESTLVAKIIKAVRAKYPTAYVRKLSDRFTRGLPDILIVARRRFGDCFTVLVEAKAKTGKQSPIQIEEMYEIVKSNAWHIVARDVESVMECLKDHGAVP